MKPFWDIKYGKDKICGITLMRLRSGKNKYGKSYVVFLPCKHGFYRSALKNAMDKGLKSCPLCRGKFDVSII